MRLATALAGPLGARRHHAHVRQVPAVAVASPAAIVAPHHVIAGALGAGAAVAAVGRRRRSPLRSVVLVPPLRRARRVSSPSPSPSPTPAPPPISTSSVAPPRRRVIVAVEPVLVYLRIEHPDNLQHGKGRREGWRGVSTPRSNRLFEENKKTGKKTN